MTAIAYGLCAEPAGLGCDQTADHCGFQPNHTINVWKSRDLSSGSWAFVTEAVAPADRTAGTIFRPDGIWNPNTNEWVLWFNAPNYMGYSAYSAPTPAGPYTLQRTIVNVTIKNATENCGDFHLFVDPADNTPYVIAGCGFHMWIERLLPNMLDSAGDTTPTGRFLFDEYFVEAPALFYRAASKTYYAVFGHCCCFCFQGSGLIVHTAPSPLGPWTPQAGASADVVCAAPAPAYGGVPTPGQGCLYGGANEVSATRAQTDAIVTVPDGAGGETHVYYGGRWGQSPDGIKGHEPQYVAPLAFDAAGAVARIEWEDVVSFQIDA